MSHEWGEDWSGTRPDGTKWDGWDDLDEAVTMVSDYCRTWGRFGGQAKEKFGCLRFYAMFHHQLHDLFYSGHYWIRWGEPWLSLDRFYLKHYKFFSPLVHLIRRWQALVYRHAYRRAAKRFPHIKHEIYIDADHQELLKDDFPFGLYWK